MLNKFLSTILLGLICASTIVASETDEQYVSNVQMKQVGKTLVITYDVSQDAIISLSYRYSDNGFIREEQLYEFGKIENNHVTGDIGYVKAGKGRQIVWDVLQDQESFHHEEVSFFVSSRNQYSGSKMGVIGTFGYSLVPEQLSGGLALTYISKIGVGCYAGFRSNYQFNNAVWGVSDSHGAIDGRMPFYSGVAKNSYWMAEAGILYNMLRNKKSKYSLSLCVSALYGSRRTLWETTDHLWVYNKGASIEGFGMGTKLIASFHGFTLMTGVSTIKFKYCEMEFGIGWTFPFRDK